MRKQVEQVRRLGFRAIQSRSFRRYLFVGVSTVAIDYVILFVLRSIFSSSLVYAVSAAYWISIVYNFSLNRHWSFQANSGMMPKQLLFYCSLLLFNYSVTLAVVAGLESMGISEYIAKIFALAITIPWTYFAYKRIIFVQTEDS